VGRPERRRTGDGGCSLKVPAATNCWNDIKMQHFRLPNRRSVMPKMEFRHRGRRRFWAARSVPIARRRAAQSAWSGAECVCPVKGGRGGSPLSRVPQIGLHIESIIAVKVLGRVAATQGNSPHKAACGDCGPGAGKPYGDCRELDQGSPCFSE
jgi:hypothetical protein